MATSYTTVKLTNGVFDQWYVTNDVAHTYSPDIPIWDAYTIMSANFNGNIKAGNIGAQLEQIDGFVIKRRKADEFDWILIKYIPVEDIRDFSFIYNDNIAQNNQEYEYAVVPVASGTEGEYIVNSVTTKFNGVFIADADRIYRFLAGVNYGTTTRNQKVGVFDPYGRKYPVIVSNGEINYNTGSISGTVLNNDYLETRQIDRDAIRKEAKSLVDFLTNKKAKIIKDWNGNMWLVAFTGNPQINYANGSGMGLVGVEAEWTEIGDANSQADLLATGMIKEVG